MAERKERRKVDKVRMAAMKAELNAAQLDTLRDLEGFGWELKFIRHKPFQPPIPVVYDNERMRYAVLNEDGSLDENPGFEIRP